MKTRNFNTLQILEEDIISFETAKLAKKAGFDEYCYQTYQNEGSISPFPILEDMEGKPCNPLDYKWCNSKIHKDIFTAPTQSLLQKWIREVIEYDIDIRCNCTSNGQYFVTVFGRKTKFPTLYLGNTYYKTYEEALEVGLYQALKLI